METLTIDANTFILGEHSAEAIADRGFSPNSYGLNLTKERGVVYFRESGTDRGANLTGNVIASTYDPSFLGNDAYLLDNEGAFYTLDGATLTKRQTDATNTYTLGTSELIVYKAGKYATSTTDVAFLSGSDLSTLDHDWWTNTRSHGSLTANFRHPQEVVEDVLYIADQNNIHTWDGTTSVDNAMSLPSDVNITSLRRHPDGRHLIAFCGITANYSHTLGGGGYIFIIDTVNLEWIRQIKIEAQVEGSINVGGVIFVTYGKKLGYFNGDGISFLKHLVTSATTYSHNLGSIEDTLIVRDGTDVLAYGDLGAGKVWWKLYRETGGTNLNNILYKGDNKLLVAYSDGGGGGELYEIDYDNAGIIGQFNSGKISFGSKVWIRRIEILHTETNGAGTSRFRVYSVDEEGNTDEIKDANYSNQTITKTRIDTNIKTDYFELRIAPSNDTLGYKKIRIYYENAE